ncbi:MAG: protein translocase subunit SecF [Longimonas sp.]|uniref:protein translocase subunit SecF n=1 Tax=Longimonas sp. TaxID=2039626 RepID=UPI003350C446
MRLLENPSFSFIPTRKIGYMISGTLILLSILSFATRGLEQGIDFLGGTEIVVENVGTLDALEVRASMAEVLDGEPEVKTFGTTGLLIRTASEREVSDIQRDVLAQFQASFPDVSPEVVQTNVVGPRFAADLQRGAIYSVLGALFVIFVYIMLRFEWRYGLGALAAITHDVIIVLGIFSLFQDVLPFSLQIDQAIIAAFLTIVGYSLNDTVVVFDRTREYLNLFKTDPYEEVVNRSMNSTLSRTVVTSVTTLIVTSILLFFGGDVLRGFSFALVLGVIIGTYSSVYVASPIVVDIRLWLEGSEKEESNKYKRKERTRI